MLADAYRDGYTTENTSLVGPLAECNLLSAYSDTAGFAKIAAGHFQD
jgi:hypothetical protein